MSSKTPSSRLITHPHRPGLGTAQRAQEIYRETRNNTAIAAGIESMVQRAMDDGELKPDDLDALAHLVTLHRINLETLSQAVAEIAALEPSS